MLLLVFTEVTDAASSTFNGLNATLVEVRILEGHPRAFKGGKVQKLLKLQ